MYLFLDTETGGLDRETSLLSAYFAITDNQLKIIQDLELNIKPDNGIYKCTGQALGINKINLTEHDKIAIPYKACGDWLYKFLDKWSSDRPREEKNKLIPVGQNVKFDINRIIDTILNQGTWDRFVSYRTIDTATVTRYLQLLGKLPVEIGGMHDLRTYLNINVEGQDHSAKTDVLINIEIFKKQLELDK